ncbi:MAG: hypothetical protein ACTHN3_12185 [Solirubrobacterales bacterium]
MPSRQSAAQVSQLREASDPARLEAELAREREEVLRLRDLLITRDAELGAAKGRLAMIEQGSQRLADAAARVPIPGATRVLQGMIRLLQRVLR